MSATPPRRTRAGGARKRPARYADTPAGPELRAALNAHRHGDLLRATDLYRAALDHDADDLDAWTNLGSVLALRGRGHEARDALLRACALASHDPRVQRDAGIGLASVGHLPDAVSALDRAVALDPTQVGAQLTLSRLGGESGEPARALAHATTATRLAPDDPSTWLELCRARYHDGDLSPARDAAHRALALAPDDPLVRTFVAALDGRDDPTLPDDLRAMLAFVRAHPARSFAYKSLALVYALACAPTDGVVVEFGVRHGVSTRVLAARCAAVHGFDSFRGLPEAWHAMPAGAFSLEGIPPALPSNVALHVGLFAETAPRFARELTAPLRFLHIDGDLYASARDALDALGPRITPGCVLAFDEYLGNTRWRDEEHRAFTEACARFGWETEVLAVSWITGQVAFRVTRGR